MLMAGKLESCHLLMVEPSTYDNFLYLSLKPTEKHVICWRLSRQHNCSFSKMQTCHMWTAQPSTYDMFAFIELYGRKVECLAYSKPLTNYFWLFPIGTYALSNLVLKVNPGLILNTEYYLPRLLNFPWIVISGGVSSTDNNTTLGWIRLP